MANLRFDDVELSTLGYSVTGINGRGMAEWRSQTVELAGRQSARGDVSTGFEIGKTSFSGYLSADTDTWTQYTHAKFLERLDALKDVIDPQKGFRKLVVSGDRVNRFRWARYSSMSLDEVRPVFKLPHHQLGIEFENLEPFWRETAATTTASVVPQTLPNDGKADARPVVEFTISGDISAHRGARVQPVTLAIIDDLQVNWKGTSSDTNGTLRAGDILIVDTETLTAVLRPGGTGAPVDVVRHYDYGGPGAYFGNGFPVIKRGGSLLSSLHYRVSSIAVRFDKFYL